MIFRPVSPASPCGPPITKRPVGLMWKTQPSRSNSSSGISGTITRSITSRRSCSSETSGECCVLTTTVSTRTGRSPSYSMVTCAFPSGRSQLSAPDFRTSESFRASRWARRIGVGISTSFSSEA